MSTIQTADRKQQTPLQEVRGQIDSMEGQFRMALPAHMPAERFVRVVMTAVSANTDLLTKCNRQSLFAAAMKAAQDGLLPDGRDAALVPFKGQVQYMPMIGGILKKIRNSGQLKSIRANVAYEKDHFFYKLGDEETIEHEPHLEGDRGKPRLVYAIAETKDGGIYREIMTVSEVEKVRAVSQSGQSATSPWTKWWEEMAKKTVLRRLSKRLPISSDLDDVIRRDDSLYDLDGARQAAIAANGGRPQSIAGKLDALSHMPTQPASDEQDASPDALDHDPQTGEILDKRPSGEGKKPEDAQEGNNGAPANGQHGNAGTASDGPRNALMLRLRGKAEKGAKPLHLALRGLVPAENEMLTGDDRKYLAEVAEEADRDQETADASQNR